jgi:hypothetical protein
MSRQRVYLCVILEPMDQETLEQLLEQLAQLEQKREGCDGALEPDRR